MPKPVLFGEDSPRSKYGKLSGNPLEVKAPKPVKSVYVSIEYEDDSRDTFAYYTDSSCNGVINLSATHNDTGVAFYVQGYGASESRHFENPTIVSERFMAAVDARLREKESEAEARLREKEADK